MDMHMGHRKAASLGSSETVAPRWVCRCRVSAGGQEEAVSWEYGGQCE